MVLNARPIATAASIADVPLDPAAPRPRVLIVDDDPVAAEALGELLRRDGFVTATAADGQAALALLDEPRTTEPAPGSADDAPPFGLLLTDLNMPRLDGLSLLRQVRRRHRGVVPIVITGFGRIDAAVEAVRLGAIEFLTKPVVADDLRLAVRKAVNQYLLLSENGTLRDRLRRHEGLGALLGNDPKMQRVFGQIDTAAGQAGPLLITGETGTGKTAVAHAIHRRAAATAAATGEVFGPMVRFAFGQGHDRDQQATLFGESGRAREARPGRIDDAAHGTLILERLDHASPALQDQLVTLLEEQTYQRPGDPESRPCATRLIFTAARDLDALVQQGHFREDLFFRLQPSAIVLPPLRERRGDLPLLAEHFLRRQGAELRKTRRLGDAALRRLQRYAFPGNVRELEQAIAHALAVSEQAEIGPDDWPEAIRGPADDAGLPAAADESHFTIPALRGEQGWTPTRLEDALRPCEKQILRAALEANGWNRSETARQLDINRVTLYKKIRAYKLDEPA